jgi:subtilisin family serine protease
MGWSTSVNVLRELGIPVFAATGNDGLGNAIHAPACLRNTISVGASVDSQFAAVDTVAPYSNTNARTDILAPASNLTTTRIGGGEATVAGTSMAAPLAAACGAVLRQAVPTLTSHQMELALRSSPVLIDDPRNHFMFPRLDCRSSLEQVAAGVGECPRNPRAGCKRPTASRASRLYMKVNSARHTRDLLKWQWKRGAATSPGEFGDPTTNAAYSFCIYPAQAPRLRLNASMPAGGLCASRPCWSSFGTGWKYADRLLSPTGISSLKLRAGDVGQASVEVKGAGERLQAPQLPLIGTVRAQLINTATNECWEAAYSSPRTNSWYPWGGSFNAYSD